MCDLERDDIRTFKLKSTHDDIQKNLDPKQNEKVLEEVADQLIDNVLSVKNIGEIDW